MGFDGSRVWYGSGDAREAGRGLIFSGETEYR